MKERKSISRVSWQLFSSIFESTSAK